MTALIISVVAGVVIVFGVMAYKVRQANQTIEKMFETQAKLTAQNQQQAVEIQQKNAEVKNAKVAQQARHIVNRSSARTIDEQLHAHGYFRDGDDHRVRGVRSNLSESGGHDRDETSDSGSQSDSSGDM